MNTRSKGGGWTGGPLPPVSPRGSDAVAPTCENAVLLPWFLPADLQRGVQDFSEAQVSHGPWHCTQKGPPPTQCQLEPERDHRPQDSPWGSRGDSRLEDKSRAVLGLERLAWPTEGGGVRGSRG